jgi:phosphoglycolate phosphatase
VDTFIAQCIFEERSTGDTKDDIAPMIGEAMPVRAILFDKDGTLIDFQRTWGPATDAVLAHFANGDRTIYNSLAAVSGFIVAEQRFRSDSVLIGGNTSDFGTAWARILGRSATTEFFSEIDRCFSAFCLIHLAPIGNPVVVLTALHQRGYRLGIATNDAQAGTRAQIERLGIATVIEFVAGYDSGFGAKPSAGPVLAFARAIGVDPPEVAVVGDSIHDLAAARAAGAIAVGLRSGPISGDVLAPYADALIDAIADLPAWLDTP